MRTLLILLLAILMFAMHGAGTCVAQGQAGKSSKTKAAGDKKGAAETLLRIPLQPDREPHLSMIRKVEENGKVLVGPPEEMPNPGLGMRQELTEGYFVGIVQSQLGPSLEGARLIRAQVVDIGEEGVVQIQLDRAAAGKIKRGETVILFRPAGITTAQMRALPDLTPLERGDADKGASAEQKARLAQSFNNLKQIGLAFHNFHDTFGRFPPAVVYGPDGKPWHSWRIFLLPYVEQAPLYNRYRWDEPWDGPNNSQLLSMMPPVYADPIHGENPDYFTHYSAVVGEGMAFGTEGMKFDGMQFPRLDQGGKRIQDFTDGTSNSLIVGPVGPDRKIPWMKPEDVVVPNELPKLGAKGSFAAPYDDGKGAYGPFLRCDGSVVGIRASVGADLFRTVLTIRGGEPTQWETLPTVAPIDLVNKMPVIYVERSGKGTSAKVVLEDAPNMPFGVPGVPAMRMAPAMMKKAAEALPKPVPAPGLKPEKSE
ncbi:MAG: DUF1559 domain-containing protein [Planctomycetales bacterium]